MAESRRNRRMIENTAQIRLGISVRFRDAGQDAWLAGLNFVAKAQDDTHRALESFAANAVFTGFAEKVVEVFGGVALRTQANADALLGRGRQEYELDKRKEIYAKTEELTNDDLPFLPLFYEVHIEGTKAGLEGYVSNVNVLANTWNAADWRWTV